MEAARIVAGFPASAGIYQALGLISTQPGLQFEEVTSKGIEEGGVAVLVVEGAIVNHSEDERQVPPIRVTLLDGGGRRLQQELFSAKLSSIQDDKTAERMAVRKAQRALVEAEEKLAMIKRWRQAYDARVEALSKQLEGLHETLSRQMPKGVVSLTNSIRLLQDYAETQTKPAPATEAERSDP